MTPTPVVRYGPPAAVSVRAALDDYLFVNGFDVRTYEAPRYEVDLVELTGDVWTFPNTAARKRAIPRHDLHHVVTGYGTDVVGEAEIGAWELVAGCNSLFLWWINLSAISVGLLLSPTRTLRAAARAVGQRSLYRDALSYAALLEMKVGELRTRLRVPAEGQAEHAPRLHRRAPQGTTAPPFSLPLPVRKALRLWSGVVNRAFGGRRVRSG